MTAVPSSYPALPFVHPSTLRALESRMLAVLRATTMLPKRTPFAVGLGTHSILQLTGIISSGKQERQNYASCGGASRDPDWRGTRPERHELIRRSVPEEHRRARDCVPRNLPKGQDF